MSDDHIGSVDVDALSAWLDGQGLPSDIEDLEVLAGGSQNVILGLRIGDRPLVLRLPPVHPRPQSNSVITREMKVLRAIADTQIPHPALFAGSDDPDVLGGRCFYLMERVDGFNPALELPQLYRDDPTVPERAGHEVAVALAQIGELDPSTLGLDDLGRPDDFLERQIARQRDLWTSFLEVDGYDPAWLPQVNETAAWLLDTIPADRRSGITHGDFHLSNLLFDRESPTLAAVLDWEMCTLGDPLVDLGWLMMCWPGADGPSIVPTGDRIVTLDAFPRRADVLPTFAEHSTRSLENLDWYIAFASFRFGIIIESNYMRALAGKISAELGQQSHDLGRRLLTVAADIAAGRWTIRDEMAATPLPRD